MSDWPRFRLTGPVEFEGVGIHTGQFCRSRVRPLEKDQGCWFVSGGERWPARPEHVVDVQRCTVLGSGGQRVSTVEHLFAALSALHLWDCEVEVEGPEIPILDGSAQPFLEALQGRLEPAGTLQPLVLRQPLWVGNEHSQILALPHSENLLHYALHYDHPLIGYQEVEFGVRLQDFSQELASARTFALRQEVDMLRAQGLAQGGSLENALVIEAEGFSSPLRLENEPVRHKCLDLLGDLYLLGRPLQARVMAVKAGHRWHVELVRRILEHVS